MRETLAALCLLLVWGLAIEPALAQSGGAQGAAGQRGLRGSYQRSRLVPPNVVMAHASVIGLTDAHRQSIIRDMQETHTNMVPLEWALRDETRKLRDLLEVPSIDENAAMVQAERIAELEGRMKRLHLRLLIRINNNLTHDQQEVLRTIVYEGPREGPAFGRGPGPRGPEVPFN